MLDMMVILTFFLIFTAVFSKTRVVEVNLPGPGSAGRRRPVPTLELEVILRQRESRWPIGMSACCGRFR